MPAKIEGYYGALIRKAATFPDRRMNYEQYNEYLSRRLSEGWEYQAIAEAFEGPVHELAGGTDLAESAQGRTHIRPSGHHEGVRYLQPHEESPAPQGKGESRNLR